MSSEMLLLGAGASVEAGIPDAKTMAKKIVEKFDNDSRLKDLAKVVRFVNECLVVDARIRLSDMSIDCVDVESLYNAMSLLWKRDELEVSAFVQSWHKDLSGISAETFESIIMQILILLEDLTLIKDADKVRHLEPILNLLLKHDQVFVATLNYDNGIELMARAKGVLCDTGIEQWSRTGILDYRSDGVGLIKLHGSVYWLWSWDARTFAERLPHRIIRTKSHFDEKLPITVLVEAPMVIFGEHNKLTAEGPFLDLLKRFDQQLQDTDLLTVVGYSFRDAHINFYISKFLNRYGGKIRIVDPGFDASNVKYVELLKDFARARPSEIEVLPNYAGDALKILYS
jgi:NAD-dependent SIR2 family protein deacetylase